MISETKLGKLLQEIEERITTVENKYEEDTQTLGKILKDQLSINKLVEESIARLEAKAEESNVSNELDNLYALVIRFDKLEKQFFALEHVTKCFFNDELMQAVNSILTDRNTGDE